MIAKIKIKDMKDKGLKSLQRVGIETKIKEEILKEQKDTSSKREREGSKKREKVGRKFDLKRKINIKENMMKRDKQAEQRKMQTKVHMFQKRVFLCSKSACFYVPKARVFISLKINHKCWIYNVDV